MDAHGQNCLFFSSVSHRYTSFCPKGHKGKENMTVGYTGASEFFKDIEVKSNYHKNIQVKVSHLLPTEIHITIFL